MVWQTRLLCDGLRGCLCSAATVGCACSCECRRVLPEKQFCNVAIFSTIEQSPERAVGSSWHARVTSASENRELASGRKAHLGPSTELSNAIIATHQHIDFFLALTTLLLSRAAITTRAPTSHRPPSKTSYLASATLRFPGLEATISTSVLC